MNSFDYIIHELYRLNEDKNQGKWNRQILSHYTNLHKNFLSEWKTNERGDDKEGYDKRDNAKECSDEGNNANESSSDVRPDDTKEGSDDGDDAKEGFD